MKILHILDHSLPLHSGYTFRSRSIFQVQKSMGHHPVILTSPKHEESLKKRTDQVETIGGFKYYRTGPVRSFRFPATSELWLMHVLYRRLLEVIEAEKPDVLHAHSPILNAIPAIRAAGRLKLPLIYEIRAFWEDAAVDHGTYLENSWKYNLTQFMETWVCKKADHVCILCNGLKNDLVSRGIPAKKITPIFNGVNPDDLKPVPPDSEYLNQWNLLNKKVIGFIGSFYRYEGLDLLVQAFAKIAGNYKDTVLLLVGGGEMETELKDRIREYGLSDRVLMPGRIPNERIAGVYSMIDILAYPRYSMRLTELVTPLKPLEAMSMEKALIASDVGGHKELIQDGETGLLFRAGDAESLIRSISKILDNHSLELRLRSNGRRWVTENHTWEKTTSEYSRIYNTVLTS